MEPDDILFDGAETYHEKNDDYGDSWRKIGKIMHMLANGRPITLDTPEDHISYGLFTRRMDKIARAFNGEFCADEMKFESVQDAHEDEAVYAAMHASNQADRKDSAEGLLAASSTDISYDSGTSAAGDRSDGPIRFRNTSNFGPANPGRDRLAGSENREEDSEE